MPAERLTLASFLERWLVEAVKPTVRNSTYESYRMLVRRHMGPELGRVLLTRLTAQQIQGFLNRKHASGLSARTVQYIHAVLRRVPGQAVCWDLVVRNVARLVSPPRVARPEVQPCTRLP